VQQAFFQHPDFLGVKAVESPYGFHALIEGLGHEALLDTCYRQLFT